MWRHIGAALCSSKIYPETSHSVGEALIPLLEYLIFQYSSYSRARGFSRASDFRVVLLGLRALEIDEESRRVAVRTVLGH